MSNPCRRNSVSFTPLAGSGRWREVGERVVAIERGAFLLEKLPASAYVAVRLNNATEEKRMIDRVFTVVSLAKTMESTRSLDRLFAFATAESSTAMTAEGNQT